MQLKTFKAFDLTELERAVNEWLTATPLIASEVVSMKYDSTFAVRAGQTPAEFVVREYSVVILYRASPTAVEG